MGENRLADVAGDHTAESQLNSVLAATATVEQVIFSAPFRCDVNAVAIIADADVTGDDTNRKNLNVIDKGADGNGTTEVAVLDLVSTPATNLDQADERAIPITATGAVIPMLKGDTLALQVEQVASGVLIPRSRIKVTFVPSAAGV